MAADVMWREIQLTAKVKPVVVSMGGMAASGGYYVAAPATRIFANPLTLTGSIGVFYGKADVSELLKKIGVNVEVYKTAPRADAESFFRPFTDEERRELERKVGQFYDMFLSRLAEGRKLKKEAVDQVAQGRVWTGEQAASRGLVDEVGGLRQALGHARTLADLPERAHAGLGSLLLAAFQGRAGRLGYTRAIHALMHEQNASRNLTRRYAQPMRRYAWSCRIHPSGSLTLRQLQPRRPPPRSNPDLLKTTPSPSPRPFWERGGVRGFVCNSSVRNG